jgi:D-alanine-D-alanine ligase
MNAAKLKIAVLYDVWEDEPAEPEVEKPTRRKKERKPRRKEKHDREEIFAALEKLGHEPFYQVVDGRPQSLAALSKCGADLVFNLTESFAGDDSKDMNITAYLDLLGIPYTGRRTSPPPGKAAPSTPTTWRFR